MTQAFRRLAGAVVWFAVIVAIALGAAGIVTGMDHPPTAAAAGTGNGGGSVAVAFPGDAEVSARLNVAEADLTDLTATVEALGTQARSALAALNGSDTSETEAAITVGDGLAADVVVQARKLRDDLAAIPYVGTPSAGLELSDAVIARHAALLSAVGATDGLDADWARLSVGSVSATRMSGYLAEHDRLMGEAVAEGRLAKYKDATALINRASAQLDAAVAEREAFKKTVDVTVLDQWISRNRDYDVALKKLYAEIRKVGNTVTAATRKAVKAEAAARARLPPDTRVLVVIMADIGRTGMNGAIIDIAGAQARLNDALDAVTPPTDDPGASPGP